MHASRTAARRQRLLALSLGVLVLGGQLTSLAHVALVKHVVCAAHGDLMHADRVEPQPAAAQPAKGSTVGARAESNGHGDQHCLLSAVRREKVTAPSLAQGQLLARAPGVLRVDLPRASLPSLALLRVAPKLSPPA